MEKKMIHTPEGVRDIYGEELLKKNHTKDKLHKTILTYGYREIQTPSFEFFDIFSKEVGTTPSKELYKFFDKEGNTLVLRPDFTPSIARCAAKYFIDDSMPIRLCYEGNAFTNASELQGKLKETTQMGVELIGDASIDADAELLCMVINSLKNCGFEQFQISIGEMEYFKGICEEACLDDETIDELREYISVKNFFGAEELLANKLVPKKFQEVLLNVNDICSLTELMKIKELVGNKRSIDAIERLSKIYELVEQYGLEKYISFDLGMLSKFHYYTGVIFKAYTYGVGDAIVKGGRYDALLHQFGKEAPAIGCVFLLDDMMSALQAQKLTQHMESEEMWIVYDDAHRKEAIQTLKQCRENGASAVGVLYDHQKSEEEYINYAKKNRIAKVTFLLG
ncbi:MAG TPA: ATP phosphoribosyltransferase regulatory subunit [Lachnospiraceae bacterium]|nr:ATP phosphoribosyltransferase regulatory subunit [Lachnospiraceae bacterium]